MRHAEFDHQEDADLPPAEFSLLVQSLCRTPSADAESTARAAFLHWALRVGPGTDPRRAAWQALLRLYPFVASAPALGHFTAHLTEAARWRPGRPRRATRRLH